MNIIMMGAQGTGKGTVAGLLKESLNVPHISTGDIFRKNIKEGTELGKIAIKYADEGKLVPDEVTNSMVRNRLNEEDCKNGFILDGYPRNIAQCPKCKRVYNMILNKPKNGEICDYCGVELTKRKDDTEEKLQIRLDTFFKETKPVIDFYANRGLVRNEEISVSINRLGVDAAKSVVDFLKNS